MKIRLDYYCRECGKVTSAEGISLDYSETEIEAPPAGIFGLSAAEPEEDEVDTEDAIKLHIHFMCAAHHTLTVTVPNFKVVGYSEDCLP